MSKRKDSGRNQQEREGGVLPDVMPLALRLACDGIHDGILWVHADGRVVLSVDDGGLPPGARHFDGLMGAVLQGARDEGGAVGGTVEVVVVGRRKSSVGEGIQCVRVG